MKTNNNSFLYNAKHIGIIMDGNRRWAKQNGLTSLEGHKKGANNVKDIIKVAIDCNIEYLTLFAFSSEARMSATPPSAYVGQSASRRGSAISGCEK